MSGDFRELHLHTQRSSPRAETDSETTRQSQEVAPANAKKFSATNRVKQKSTVVPMSASLAHLDISVHLTRFVRSASPRTLATCSVPTLFPSLPNDLDVSVFLHVLMCLPRRQLHLWHFGLTSNCLFKSRQWSPTRSADLANWTHQSQLHRVHWSHWARAIIRGRPPQRSLLTVVPQLFSLRASDLICSRDFASHTEAPHKLVLSHEFRRGLQKNSEAIKTRRRNSSPPWHPGSPSWR